MTAPSRTAGAGERARGTLPALAVLALALLLPFVLEGYELYRLSALLVLALAVLGLNLLAGLTGILSIGHGAFLALGGYVSAVGMQQAGLSFYATLPLAAAACFLLGVAIGFPALRLSSVHLVLVTFSLALVVPQVLKSSHLEPWTNGVMGLYLDRPAPPAWSGLNDDQWWYFLILALFVLGAWCARNLWHSRTGRALAAIRDAELAAPPQGIPVARYKCLIFGISGLYGGLAGAMNAIVQDFIAPDGFTLWLSIVLLIAAVTGGVRTVWGALLGAALVLVLPAIAGGLAEAVNMPLYGIVLLVFVLVLPDGLAPALERLASTVGKRLRRRSS